MAKRYYWLKLKKDFFQQPEITILEQEEEGREILLFYLKLLLLGVDQEGRLRLNEKMPYTAKTLAMLTKTPPETANKAMELLMEYGLLEKEPDGTLYLPGLSEMVGSESESAVKMRKSRNKPSHCDQNVTQSKSIEKEIETESDPDLEKRRAFFVSTGLDSKDFFRVNLPYDQQQALTNLMGYEKLMHYLEKIEQFAALKCRPVKDPYQTILKWYREDQ